MNSYPLLSDFWLVQPLALIAGIACFLMAVYVYFQNLRSPLNWLWSLVGVCVGFWCLGAYQVLQATDHEAGLLAMRLIHFAAIPIPILHLHFTYHLLDIRPERWKLIRIGYFITAVLFVSNFTPLFVQDAIPKPYFRFYAVPGLFYHIFTVLYFGASFLWSLMLIRTLRHLAPLRRIQAKYVLIASVIGILGGAATLPIVYSIPFPPYPALLVALYPFLIAYAIVRHRLMDIRLAATRTAVFMVVYAAVLGLPLWGASVWQSQLEEFLGARWWMWILIGYAILATAAHYANLFLQKKAENQLLAEQRSYQAILQQASQGMTLIKELDKLLRLIVHLLTRKVRIGHAAIYLWDEKSKRFHLKASRQLNAEQSPVFPRDNPLVEYLQWHRSPLLTEELHLQVKNGFKELQPVLVSLKELEATVLVPSFVEDRCVGLLVLGDKLSGTLYTSDDLQVFQVLASQAALAIENAQFYEELQRTQADLFQTGKMASLGHMAGGMSHQINNRFHVLTILAGTMKSVLKDVDPHKMSKEQFKKLWDKNLETLAKVEENSLRGGDIVKTLLRFSRPSGEYTAVQLPQILNTAEEVVQFRVNMDAFDLIKEIPKDLPPIKGDLNQLADSCFNLISNAFDAMQKKADLIGDSQLSLGPRDPDPYRGKFWIRAYVSKRKEEKPSLILELEDNGVGMSEQDLESLFVPFFTTKATAQKGTGLGLYVIQRIMEQHGGSIKASSEYGVGTTFRIELPLATEAT